MMRRRICLAALALALPAACLMAGGRLSAQDKQKPLPTDGMPDLAGTLRKTPGVLGVEAARTQSGKNVIFAWFENRKAVVDWYDGPVHQGLMNSLSGPGPYRKPLEQVKEDSGPILVIASLTPADKPHFKEMKLPVSQIAIELYQPLPGGAAMGGRFAPGTVKVQNLLEYHPEQVQRNP